MTAPASALLAQTYPVTTLSAGIVADDLTGAGDSAVQFAARGWQARLTLGDPFAVTVVPGSVVAVVTDSRAQHADAARLSTSSAVAALMGAGIDRLFVKIDSTMRGSVIHQVRGALDAWTRLHPGSIAVVCPAYPAMGRTVEGGLLLVDGAGVETTSVGRDPVTPVTTSALAELLPGSIAVQAGHADAPRLAALIFAASSPVVTVDASTDADLEVLAAAIELLGARAVPVGSAGLAVQMSRVWGSGVRGLEVQGSGVQGPRVLRAREQGRAVPDSSTQAAPATATATATSPATATATATATSTSGFCRAVVVVSSLHDVSRAQHAHLVEASADVLTLAPTLAEILGSDDAMAGWIRENVDQGASASVIVILSPAERAGDGRAPLDGDPDGNPHRDGASARDAASTTTPDPVRIAAALAAIADAVVSGRGTGSLVLMGGEGARAVLDRFEAESVVVTHAIGEGVPIGVIDGGRLHGLTVVTKAGGFGSTSALSDLLPELLERPTQGASS